MTQIINPYIPEPRQILAHKSNKRHVLFGGAMGGGKSAWISGHVIDRMWRYPGNRGYIGRKNYSDFSLSTYLSLKKFLKPYEDAGLVVENQGKKVFKFNNESNLYYGAIEPDQSKDGEQKNPLFSSEFGIIAIDEVYEISEKQFEKLSTRMRHTLPKDADNWYEINKKGNKCPHYQIIMATNPAQNWVKKRFVTDPDPVLDDFIVSLPGDNSYNPDDYIDVIRRTFKGDEKFIKAYVEGSWEGVGEPNDLFIMDDIRKCFYEDPLTGRINNPCLKPYEHRAISIDPAYFGDDKTVLYGWENFLAKKKLSYGKQPSTYTLGEALKMQSEMKANCVFGIDNTGGWGTGVNDQLKQMYQEGFEEHIRVHPIVFSERDGIEEAFYNMRAKLYWQAAELVRQNKIPIPQGDAQLHEDLCAIKYFRKGGKIYIESKDEIKKRLGRSPDSSDAWVIGIHIMLMMELGMINIAPAWVEEKPVWVKKRQQHILEDQHEIDSEIYYG